MLGTIKAGVKAVGTALNIARWFQKRSDRNRDRDAGRNEERLKTRDKTDEARERMDKVKPSDSRATARKLRRKRF